MNKLTLNLSQHPELTSPALTAIFNAITNAGGEARIVGGAVRDAMLGNQIGEIDLAVNLIPQKVIEALQQAKIKAVPTGIEHGTITAVVDHKGYELTSLRKDVETYGRHAKVDFTDDWKADAARRDFTFNALYADAKGNVYDYFNGHEDLKNGHVKFIGTAQDRIREDYLRILRYFRFYAWFGKGQADSEAIQACKELAANIKSLSVERIWKELSKLLMAQNPVPSVRLMLDNKIFEPVLPEATNSESLQKLIEIEKKFNISPDYIRRFASIINIGDDRHHQIPARLHFSNREKKHFYSLIQISIDIQAHLQPTASSRIQSDYPLESRTTEKYLHHLLYNHNAGLVRDALLLAAANQDLDISSSLKIITEWNNPTFPLQGLDILNLGIPPGPNVGKILKAVEEWWIENDFMPTKEQCLSKAQEVRA